MQGRLANIWKENILKNLELEDQKFVSARELLIALKREFGKRDDKLAKVVIVHLDSFFLKKSTIYYTEYIGRPWQLLCNYLQKDQNYMELKSKIKRDKAETKERSKPIRIFALKSQKK